MGNILGQQQNANNAATGGAQPDTKRPHPPEMDPSDSISLYAESSGPLVREDGHYNDSSVPKEASFVAVTQATTDNMSDLFPQKSSSHGTASKRGVEQQLDVAEDIFAQVEEEMLSIESFGEKILENLAKRVVSQFQLDPNYISKEMLNRNNLPENCAEISVPAMNAMIKEIKNFESICPAERRDYNIQANIMRATAAITQMADMVLVADQGGKMANSKKLIRSALDGVIFLGQAQSLLNNARKINVRGILAEDTWHICSLDKKPTQFLFGDDVSKSIKESKEMHHLSSGLGQKLPVKKRKHFTPQHLPM